jgi:hypothetical protein
MTSGSGDMTRFLECETLGRNRGSQEGTRTLKTRRSADFECVPEAYSYKKAGEFSGEFWGRLNLVVTQ